MQISAANLLAAQQAAQRALAEKSALAAKQAARTAATAPAFAAALTDFQAVGPARAAEKAAPAAPVQPAPAPQAGVKLGQHINIVI